MRGNSPLQRLGIWKNLGPVEKPSRSHPRMLFLQAQHHQEDPLGWPCPGWLLQLWNPGPWPGPALLIFLLPCSWAGSPSHHLSSRMQWSFDLVKWPLILLIEWRHRTVYGAALPEHLDGWSQSCSKNAGNASQIGSWRLVLTFTAIFKIPLPWWGWVGAGDRSFIWPHLSPEVTEN